MKIELAGVEVWTDIDGVQHVDYYKEATILGPLKLRLYNSGQATIEYDGQEVDTFMWDDEVAELFDKSKHSDELFNAIERRSVR